MEDILVIGVSIWIVGVFIVRSYMDKKKLKKQGKEIIDGISSDIHKYNAMYNTFTKDYERHKSIMLGIRSLIKTVRNIKDSGQDFNFTSRYVTDKVNEIRVLHSNYAKMNKRVKNRMAEIKKNQSDLENHKTKMIEMMKKI